MLKNVHIKHSEGSFIKHLSQTDFILAKTGDNGWDVAIVIILANLYKWNTEPCPFTWTN